MRQRFSKPANGFTLIELVITIFLMGLVAAFAIPQISSAFATGQEQHAKATINGALDAVVSSYGRGGANKPWQSNGVASDLTPPQPETSQALVRNQSPDVRVTDHQLDPSTANNQVSIGTSMKQNSSGSKWWRVGVASWSGDDDNPTCWVSWRDLDAPASSGMPSEAFYYIDLSHTAVDPSEWSIYCTGKVAANLPWIPAESSIDALKGRSWSTPREIVDQNTVINAYNASD